jgi:hypothetical protein
MAPLFLWPGSKLTRPGHPRTASSWWTAGAVTPAITLRNTLVIFLFGWCKSSREDQTG